MFLPIRSKGSPTAIGGFLDKGGDPFPETTSVRDFTQRWLDHKTTSGVRPRSVNRYRGLLAHHVLPVIGSMRLDPVKVGHVRNVLDKAAAKGLAPRTVQHVRAVMSGLFGTALSWELIATNPVKATQAVTASRSELEVPTAEQAMAVLEAANGTQWATPILLSIATGARRSEVLGLKWSEVDLDKRRVQIVRNLQRVPGEGRKILRAEVGSVTEADLPPSVHSGTVEGVEGGSGSTSVDFRRGVERPRPCL